MYGCQYAFDLFKGIVARSPWVDVVTSQSDSSIPLTTGEYAEEGNPANEAVYFDLKAYSPYDNVAAKNYTNLLITTSYDDSQVQYFEPTKLTAKLRALKTDNNLLLLYCNMHGAHGITNYSTENLKLMILLLQQYG